MYRLGVSEVSSKEMLNIPVPWICLKSTCDLAFSSIVGPNVDIKIMFSPKKV